MQADILDDEDSGVSSTTQFCPLPSNLFVSGFVFLLRRRSHQPLLLLSGYEKTVFVFHRPEFMIQRVVQPPTPVHFEISGFCPPCGLSEQWF